MKRRRPVIVFIAALAVHSRAQVSESALPIEVTVPVAPIPTLASSLRPISAQLLLVIEPDEKVMEPEPPV